MALHDPQASEAIDGSRGNSLKKALPIELTPEQRTLIERKIAAALAGNDSRESTQAAAAWNALPLYDDWSACMALRLDGEIVWLEYEAPHESRLVEDEVTRNVGLFQASVQDPELRFLAPARPPDAVACPGCGGSGQCRLPRGSEHLADRVVCTCGGLGWLPPR